MKQFRQISNFPNYSITNTGRVWNNKYNRWLKSVKQPNGYLTVDLGYRNRQFIHRLVLETFVRACPEGKECCHNNGVKDDNRLENLRWDTRKNNIADAMKHGTHICLSRMKLTEQNVINIIHLWNTKLFLQREIAEMYNISRRHVGQIVNRKRWKHI